MAVENLTGATYIHTTWTDLSAQAAARNLEIQYFDDTVQYYIWVADDKLIYSTVIFQGTIPPASDYASQAANDADKSDFETTYKPTANHRIEPETFDLDTGAGIQHVLGVSLRKGSSGGSVDFGTATDPIRVDPTGTTTQPISGAVTVTSGTVTANQGTAAALAGAWPVEITDGTNVLGTPANPVRTDPTGTTTQPITGTGTAGTPAAGVVTIQGITGGEPIPISGSITATNPSVGVNNAPDPGSSTQIGGSDGTNLQAAMVWDLDTGAGTDYELGVSLRLPGAGGSVAGGTATNPIRTDPTGTTTQPVSGTVTANQGTAAALSGYWPVRVTDGTNTMPTGDAISRAIFQKITDGTNTATVTAASALKVDGSAVVQPISSTQLPAALVGGRLDTNIGSWLGSTAPTVGQKTSANSLPVVIASDQSAIPVSSTPLVQATFTVVAPAVLIGNNKSMLSILNASGSTVIVKIPSIYVVNVQTTALTGVIGTFELRRITGHSAGTLLTSETMDTTDTQDAAVTLRTGSTVAGESATLMLRQVLSTDEWGQNNNDTGATNAVLQRMIPVFRKLDESTKSITLRANEGITVKFATNSTAGTFDIIAIFTQE